MNTLEYCPEFPVNLAKGTLSGALLNLMMVVKEDAVLMKVPSKSQDWVLNCTRKVTLGRP